MRLVGSFGSDSFYCWRSGPPLPVVDGDSPGVTGIAGGAAFGAMPVVAGGLTSLRAVLVLSLLVNTSASTTMMNTSPAIHPHGVGGVIMRSISIRRSMYIHR